MTVCASQRQWPHCSPNPCSLPMLSTAIKRSRLNTSILLSRHQLCSMAAPASTKTATASNTKGLAPHWPLSFTLQLPKPQPNSLESHGFSSNQALPPRWWSHRLYHGPEDKEIEIMYSKTKAESEVIAQRFLDEPVIGFDMEWPWGFRVKDTLQNKIGLIQIASEDKIGLFHIGLHSGKTTDGIIAPTLKKIIEDPNIGKAGVNILRADFSRLSRFFGLQPRGAVELSNLYRLVKFGSCAPEYVSVKLVSLAQQVEEQLGLPLYKGDVRTSNWSKPLSKAQIDYAAGDAYAGFMLYKCMNAKRLAMKPTPPTPIYAEKYPSGKASRDDPIILDVGDGTTITTAEFFHVYPKKTGKTPMAKAAAPGTNPDPLDENSQGLYNELLLRRALLAEKASIPPTRVISDILLQAIARACPHDTPSLLGIKGMGKVQQQRYGDEWLQVIAQFLKAKGIEQPVSTNKASASKEEELQAPRTPRRRRANRKDSSDSLSSLAFDEPVPKPPQLHTGLSFTLAESKLDTDGKLESDSDDSLPSLDFGTPPSERLSSSKKRKRIESPRKQHHFDPDSHEPREIPPDNQPSNAREFIHQRTPGTKSKGHLFNEPSLSHALSLAKPPITPSRSVPTPQKGPLHPSVPLPLPQAQSSNSATEISPPSRIAKAKLLAFSKLVTRKLPEPRPPTAPPIVTPHTLDLIVRARPQTQEDLERIPGVDSLILACERTGMDLLRNVIKFIGDGD